MKEDIWVFSTICWQTELKLAKKIKSKSGVVSNAFSKLFQTEAKLTKELSKSYLKAQYFVGFYSRIRIFQHILILKMLEVHDTLEFLFRIPSLPNYL